MLARAGWYNSDPSTVEAAPVDKVIKSYYYELFCRDYEKASIELNREK
jgi:hypothetical protein